MNSSRSNDTEGAMARKPLLAAYLINPLTRMDAERRVQQERHNDNIDAALAIYRALLYPPKQVNEADVRRMLTPKENAALTRLAALLPVWRQHEKPTCASWVYWNVLNRLPDDAGVYNYWSRVWRRLTNAEYAAERLVWRTHDHRN